MIIPAAQIKQALSLDARGLSAVLTDSGYPTKNEINDAQCLGLSSTGLFVYSITFADDEDAVARGSVFIKLEHDPISTKWVMKADY